MRSLSPYALVLTLLASSLAAAPLWFAAGSAHAQQNLDDDRAKAHFFAGESHYAAGRFEDAEREFALAYDLSRRPEMLINLSRSQERGGQLEKAIASLQTLVNKHPEHSYRAEAEVRIAAMQKELAERPAAPVPAPVPVAEPEPTPESTPLPPVVAEQEPVQDRGIWPPSLLTMSLGGAAVVTAVVALGTGLRAHGLYNDLEGRCPASRCLGEYEDDRDRGRALSRTSTAMTFVSVALAGTAAVFWVYDVKKKRDVPSVAFGIDGAGARLRAQF